MVDITIIVGQLRPILKFFFFHFRWQARREQDRNMRAGLIPSRALQERRIVHERNVENGDADNKEGI